MSERVADELPLLLFELSSHFFTEAASSSAAAAASILPLLSGETQSSASAPSSGEWQSRWRSSRRWRRSCFRPLAANARRCRRRWGDSSAWAQQRE